MWTWNNSIIAYKKKKIENQNENLIINNCFQLKISFLAFFILKTFFFSNNLFYLITQNVPKLEFYTLMVGFCQHGYSAIIKTIKNEKGKIRRVTFCHLYLSIVNFISILFVLSLRIFFKLNTAMYTPKLVD